ncbi:hypothetical protein ACOME3_005919 [Neoechinorhynchus agilis]
MPTRYNEKRYYYTSTFRATCQEFFSIDINRRTALGLKRVVPFLMTGTKRRPSFLIDDILRNHNDDHKISAAQSTLGSFKRPKIEDNEERRGITLLAAQQSSSSQLLNLPSWIFCTRYSDRPGSGN